jgi:hypothetical protein
MPRKATLINIRNVQVFEFLEGKVGESFMIPDDLPCVFRGSRYCRKPLGICPVIFRKDFTSHLPVSTNRIRANPITSAWENPFFSAFSYSFVFNLREKIMTIQKGFVHFLIHQKILGSLS